jgi:uncharacterized protein (DUF1697 family)
VNDEELWDQFQHKLKKSLKEQALNNYEKIEKTVKMKDTTDFLVKNL